MKSIWIIGTAVLLTACPKPCSTNAECNDGQYCNGEETCVNGGCTATPVVCDDGIACTIDRCSEAVGRCQFTVVDADGDGHGDRACVDSLLVPLGDDCDDHDPLRFPGNTEVCDAAGHDEDCDLTTVGTTDADHDGYISSACANISDAGVLRGTVRGLDCDDDNEGVHPGQLETCNGFDDNCNGLIDEGVRVTRYADNDGDGWGAGPPLDGCLTDPGTSHLGTDCDDTNAAMHPGEFRCAVKQGLYELCQPDGGFFMGICGGAGTCVTQPNGLGDCR